MRFILFFFLVLTFVFAKGQINKTVDTSHARQSRINFTPTVFYNTYSAGITPVLKIKAGDTVYTESLDALGFDRDSVRRGKRGNPLTGPFFIEDALPGDVIAITIVKLSLNRKFATTLDALIPKVLPKSISKQTWRQAKLVKWNLDLENNLASPEKKYEHISFLKVPLEPFLGSVGVAPKEKKGISSGGFGSWGGNLDFSSITESATLFLPVYHQGALLFLGDGHAVQGDGELNGDALETSMDFAFTIRIIRNEAANLKYPRVENAQYIMAFGQAKNLDDAVSEATQNLLRWLEKDYGLSLEEASQVIGPTIEYKIPKIAASEVEVVAKIKKEFLKGLK
jgi:amidase